MKKLNFVEIENIKAGGPKLCWGSAIYYSVVMPWSAIGLVLGASCYVASL